MKRFLKASILLSLFTLFLLSCTSNWTKNSGSVTTDDDIKAMFEAHEYVSGYNYFYTANSWTNSPVAIVGIKEEYELVKDSNRQFWTNWQQLEPGSERLKELIEAMDNTTSYGYILYAPDGEDQIGVMYTTRFGIVYPIKSDADKPEIRFKEENLIAVKPKTHDISGFSGAP